VSSAALERSYARAERVTAHWAKSFYFASRFVPPAKRRSIFALYDYCRYADNLVDLRGERPVEEVREQLALLAATVRGLHAGGESHDPRWLAFADTLRRHPIPLRPLLELLDGVATDLDPVEMRTFAELERYSYQVAGVVGLMLGPVLGAERTGYDSYGVQLGIAMQLTNVLRDVGEDLAEGRVYLPADELAAFGLSRAALERRVVTPEFRRFMAFQVRRARQHFAAGDAVVDLFPPDGSRMTVRLMQRTYAGILDAIERHDYDVFRLRAHVSSPRKLAILGHALWQEYAPLAALPREQSA
jgi:phytoene synthase